MGLLSPGERQVARAREGLGSGPGSPPRMTAPAVRPRGRSLAAATEFVGLVTRVRAAVGWRGHGWLGVTGQGRGGPSLTSDQISLVRDQTALLSGFWWSPGQLA